MVELEKQCPFCGTRGFVKEYCPSTSMFQELYQCERCYQIFDDIKEKDREFKLKVKKLKKEREKTRKKKKNFKMWLLSLFRWK